MKPLILILFSLIVQNCFGQHPPFDKVIISYSKGHNSWGDTGVYSKQELFEISPIKSGGYKFSKFLDIKFTASPIKYRKDTIRVNTRKLTEIPGSKIDSLFDALQITRDNFTTSFIKPKLFKPSKKEIVGMAVKIDSNFKVKDEDASELNEKIVKIQGYDKLDLYIKLNKPDTAVFKVTVDVWNVMNITFVRQKDTTVFQLDFLQPLGQPMCLLKVNQKHVDKQFANLEVNLLLAEILPALSRSKKRAGINNLKEDYIRWYIEKQLQYL